MALGDFDFLSNNDNHESAPSQKEGLGDFMPRPPRTERTARASGERLTDEELDAILAREGATDLKPIVKAIVVQESGGNKNVGNSHKGAVGLGQMMPDTFMRFARDGESIHRPEDNLAASIRYIKFLNERAGGDPAKIATGYFSGEGNIGKDRPWKKDRSDGKKSVSSYVADVMGRLGADTPQQQEAQDDAPAKKAPSWQSIASDPRYADLTDEEKAIARQHYFRTYLEPAIKPEERDATLAWFEQEATKLEPKKQGLIERMQANAAEVPDNGFVDPMTGIDASGAQGTIEQAPRRASVMLQPTEQPAGVQSTTPLNPQARAAIEARYNAASPQERAAMVKVPGAVGDYVRAVDQQYQQVQANPATDMLDRRYEARQRQLERDKLDPSLSQAEAKRAALRNIEPGDELGAVGKVEFDMDGMQHYREAMPIERGAAQGVERILRASYGVTQAMAELTGIDSLAESMERATKKSNIRSHVIGQGNDPLSRNFEAVVASLAQQVPLMIGGAVTGAAKVTLGGIGAQAFGQEYAEGRAQGQSGDEAAVRAGLFAITEMAGEYLSLGNSLDAIKAAAKGVPTKDLAEILAQGLLKEIPGEQATTLGQFLTDKLPGNIGLNPEAGLQEYLHQAADTLVQTVMQSGMMMGGTSGVAAAARHLKNNAPSEAVAEHDADAAKREALAKAEKMFAPLHAKPQADTGTPTDTRIEPTLEPEAAEVAPEQNVAAEPAPEPSAATPQGFSDEEVVERAVRIRDELLDRQIGVDDTTPPLSKAEENDLNFIVANADDPAKLREYFHWNSAPDDAPQEAATAEPEPPAVENTSANTGPVQQQQTPETEIPQPVQQAEQPQEDAEEDPNEGNAGIPDEELSQRIDAAGELDQHGKGNMYTRGVTVTLKGVPLDGRATSADVFEKDGKGYAHISGPGYYESVAFDSLDDAIAKTPQAIRDAMASMDPKHDAGKIADHLTGIEKAIADGIDNAAVVPSTSDHGNEGYGVRAVAAYEAQLERAGWTRHKKRGGDEWTKGDATLFVRSQGDTASPVVQWKSKNGAPPGDAPKAAKPKTERQAKQAKKDAEKSQADFENRPFAAPRGIDRDTFKKELAETGMADVGDERYRLEDKGKKGNRAVHQHAKGLGFLGDGDKLTREQAIELAAAYYFDRTKGDGPDEDVYQYALYKIERAGAPSILEGQIKKVLGSGMPKAVLKRLREEKAIVSDEAQRHARKPLYANVFAHKAQDDKPMTEAEKRNARKEAEQEAHAAAARRAQPRVHQYDPANAEPLILVACSATKQSGRHRAIDLYTGSMFQVLKKWMPKQKRPEIFIISAKHGLLHADEEIDSYDERLTNARRAELIDAGIDVRKFTGKSYNEVFIAGGKTYGALAQEYVRLLKDAGFVGPDAKVTMTEGGIGTQRSQLGQYLRALPGAPRQPTPGERMRERLWANNPFMAFLGTFGLHTSERSDVGGERSRAVTIPGFPPLFRSTGKRLDELASLAVEHGFMTPADLEADDDNGGMNKLASLIERAAMRREIIPRVGEEADIPEFDADEALFAEAADLGLDIDDKSPEEVFDMVMAEHRKRAEFEDWERDPNYQKAFDELLELERDDLATILVSQNHGLENVAEELDFSAEEINGLIQEIAAEEGADRAIEAATRAAESSAVQGAGDEGQHAGRAGEAEEDRRVDDDFWSLRDNLQDISRVQTSDNDTRVNARVRLKSLRKKLEAGKISAAEFAEAVSNIINDMDAAADVRDGRNVMRDRKRGELIVREKLLAARRRDQIAPELFELTWWMLNQAPHLAEGVALSIRTPKEGLTAGRYNPAGRLVTLFTHADGDTGVHELLHHAERMMPADVQDAIRREHVRAWKHALRDAVKAKQKDVVDGLLLMAEAWRGSQGAVEQLMQMFSEGKLTKAEHYQYVSSSEFWAVNATRIVADRAATGTSWVRRAVQWLRELGEKIKGIFGLKSDARVLKGLEAVLKGDGQFQSKSMLSDGAASFDNINTVQRRAAETISNELLDSFGPTVKKFRWYHKIFSTQLHKSKINPGFRPAYIAASRLLNHVSLAALRAADLAQSVLPRADQARVAARMLFGRGALPQASMQKVAQAVFAGTLHGANVYAGKVWSVAELESKFHMNKAERDAYIEVRAAIDQSLLEAGIGEAWGIARPFVKPELRETVIDKPERARDVLIDKLRQTLAGHKLTIANLEQRLQRAERDVRRAKTPWEQADAKVNEFRTLNRGRVLPDDLKRDLDDTKKALDAAMNEVERVKGLISEAQNRAAPVSKAIEAVNEVFDTVEKLQRAGYAPLSRFGQYTVEVVAMDHGKPVRVNGEIDRIWFGRFDNEREARRMERLMRQKYPDAAKYSIRRGIIDPGRFKSFQGINPETLELFASTMGIAPDTVAEKYIEFATSDRSALKRRLEREGVAGFSEDLPRVLASFITSNGRFAAQRFYLRDIKRARAQVHFQDGDTEEEVRLLEEAIMEPKETAHRTRALMFLMYMGGSFAAAAVNASQSLTMTLPYLSQFGFARAHKALGNAIKLALQPGKIDPQSALGRALQRASDEGKVDAQEIFHLYSMAIAGVSGRIGGEGARNKVQAAMTLAGAMFSIVEKFNRRVAFIAAYQMAEEMRQSDPSVIPYNFASDTVEETQGVYNKANAPNFTRNVFGALVMQFKQYAIMYLELMTRLWKSGKEGKRAVLYATAILIMVAGIEGLPFMKALNDLIDTLLQMMNFNANSKRAKREVLEAVVGEWTAEYLTNGVSGMIGIDLSQRMGLHAILPATDFFKRSNEDKARSGVELLGAPSGLARNIIDAVDAIGAGRPAEAVRSVMPKAVKDVWAGGEMLATGQAKDTKGRKVADVHAGHAAAQALGFNPNVKAEGTRRRNEFFQDRAMAKAVQQEITGQLARGLMDRDRDEQKAALEKLRDWNRNNPELAIRVTPESVKRQATMGLMDADQRMIRSTPKQQRGEAMRRLEKD